MKKKFCNTVPDAMIPVVNLDLSRIYAALIAHLGCLAFESQGAFASQR